MGGSMIPRPIETLPPHNSNEVIVRSVTGRTELMAAIAGLVEKVERLALNVERIVRVADETKVERAETAAHVAAECASEETGQFNTGSAVKTCAVQRAELVEASTFPLSPHQNSWACNVVTDEIIGDANTKIEAAFSEREDDKSSRAKNAIAGRVLELHDRLGGFIKPPLPESFDQTAD